MNATDSTANLVAVAWALFIELPISNYDAKWLSKSYLQPGGKSRLAREITIQAAVDGALVLWGGCYEYEAATPYLPFVEAFRRWVREETNDDLWLGPLYIQVLLAAEKRDEAAQRLADYQALVADCQTPRFTAEAAHLATLF